MITAAYARYSSDAQRETSITDQLRNCDTWAAGQGFAITRPYSDSAISGSKVARADYQRMLADAQAGRFDVLVLDSLERLGRDLPEFESAIQRLEFWGVRVVSVSDGYDSTAPKQARKVQRIIKAMLGNIQLDDLADKTHRGLTGQAMAGNSAGGKSYGYRSEPIEDPARTDQFGRPRIVGARKVIDDEQADIVRQIFKRFAEGASTLDIARELNQRGIPSPRGGTWSISALYGRRDRTDGILSNPLYIGKYIWNRTQWIKEPGTGKRKRLDRPQSEWIIQDQPELRIVDQAIWNQVKARQKAQQARGDQVLAGMRRPGTGRGPGYLLSGLLKCGCCGSNFIMVNGSRYGCNANKTRGESVCDNDLRVKRTLAEDLLLSNIKQALLGGDYFREFMKEYTRLTSEENGTEHIKALEKELAATQKKIDNIMKAIEAGILTASTQERLQQAEQTKIDLQASIEAHKATQHQVAHLLPNAEKIYIELVEGLAEIDDIPRARELIKQLIGDEIVLHPAGKERDHLVAEIHPAPAALLPPGQNEKIMVAGACYTTFLTFTIPLVKS